MMLYALAAQSGQQGLFEVMQLYLAGGVLIDGPVGGDLVVFGGGINLGEKAVINGDVITFGGGVSRHDDAIISIPVIHENEL